MLDFATLTLASKSLDVDFSLLQSFVQHDLILIIFCAYKFVVVTHLSFVDSIFDCGIIVVFVLFCVITYL